MAVIVVGGGIVGLCCAHHLAQRGRKVVVVDRGGAEAPPGASFGNAGGIAVTECVPASVPGLWRRVPGWLLDPLGPLHLRPAQLPRLAPWLAAFLRAGRPERVRAIADALSALNSQVFAELEPLLVELGLAGQLHRVGALVLYRDEAARAADALEWEMKRARGVRAEPVGRAEIAELEPAVGPAMTCGVFQPDWAHVDEPGAIVRALRARLAERGVAFETGEASAVTRAEGRATGVELAGGRRLQGEAVVIAAGAWSARLAGDPVRLESERGYNTTLPDPGVEVGRELIFGAEKFVATPLALGLRIGGGAEFAGLEAPANLRRAEALLTLATRALPGLRTDGGRAWMGHRPATPDSLPVIGSSPSTPGLFHAFGHGHLGLTQAAPTGRLIADLVTGAPPPFDPAPFSIARFGRSAR